MSTIREELKHFLETHKSEGITLRSVGKAIDWSYETLSLWIRNDYTGNNEAVDRDVAGYLARMKQRDKVKTVGKFVKTRQAISTIAALRYAHTRGKMGLIIGPSGSGKTRAIRQYAASQAGVIFLTTDDVSNGPSGIIHDLAEALDLKTRGTLRGILRAITKKLSGSGRLIIVDEAQTLRHHAIEVLRKIHDTTEVAIVFSGMPRLYHHMVGNGVEIFEQIRNRIAIKKDLPPLNLEDSTLILHSFDESISAETCRVAHQLSMSCGRRLVLLYDQAACEAAEEERPITPADFISAQEFLYEETAQVASVEVKPAKPARIPKVTVEVKHESTKKVSVG